MKILEIRSDKGLVLQLFEAAMNLAPIDVFCIFGKQNFLKYLMLVVISSSLDFCVYEYVDVEFLFLFGKTYGNNLEM